MRPRTVLVLAVLLAALLPDLASGAPSVDRLEAALAGELPAPCLTPYVLDVQADWERLTPEERHRADWQISPAYRGRVAAGGPTWLEGDPWADAPRDACFPNEWAAHDGQPYANQLASEHFILHWNANGLTSEAEAEAMSEALEHAYTRLVEEQGFHPPAGVGECQMVAAVEPMGGIAGYATGVWINDQFRPYVVFNAGLLQEAESQVFREEVAAHELFHTIQYVYGFEEFIEDWETSPNRWWLEASATYQQGLAIPAGADYLEYFSLLWVVEPWLSMETHNAAGHQYGMFVWPLGIEAGLGDDGAWHRAFWEQLEGRRGYSMRQEFDDFFTARGTSFLERYGHWLALAAEGDLPRYDFLWGVRHLNRYAYLDNSTTEEYGALDLPAEGEVESGNELAPEYLGAGFVWFGLGQAEEGKALVMHFQGDVEVDGAPVEWAVEFAAVRAEQVLERYSATPVLSSDGSSWEAHVRLDGVHGAYDGAWMIASPVADFGDGRAGWGWAAELRADQGGSGFSEAAAGRGCTQDCQASGVRIGWVGVLLPLVVLGGRRRRFER